MPSARVLRSGGWSPISALLSCGGNLIRIFTTLTVTKSRLLLVSFGIGMQYALEAADKLTEQGISAEVIDLRTLRPIDYDTVLASVQKTNRCVTVEEGFPVGAIGNHLSAVIMQRAFDYLDAPVMNCTGKDVPMPYAANLERHALITTDEVIAAVHSVTYR